MKLKVEGEPVASFPSVVPQQCAAGDEVPQRRIISGCRLRTLARNEVQLSDMFAFLRRADQRRATTELVDDIKDVLLEVLRGRPDRDREEPPARGPRGRFPADLSKA